MTLFTKVRAKATAIFMGAMMALCALSACQTTGTTTTISTSTLEADTTALITLVNNIMQDTTVTSKMSADDLTTMASVEKNMESIEASITATTGGTVTIDTGKEWVNSIVKEIDLAISVAQPIVTQYDPDAAKYLTLASSLMPFIEAIVDDTTSSTNSSVVLKHSKYGVGTVMNGHLAFGQSIGLTDAQIRQEIWQGIH